MNEPRRPGMLESPKYLLGRRLLLAGTAIYLVHFLVPVRSGSCFVDLLLWTPGPWNLFISSFFIAPVIMTLLGWNRWASRVVPIASTGVMTIMAVSSLIVGVGFLLVGGFLLFGGWDVEVFSGLLFLGVLGIVLMAGWRLFGNRKIADIDPGARLHLGQAILLVIASPLLEYFVIRILSSPGAEFEISGIILGAVGWGTMLVGCHLILSGRLRPGTSPSAN